MKRYCQTLELVDDPGLIERYCDIHSHVWPEVVAGQREVHIPHPTQSSVAKTIFSDLVTVGR